MNQSARLAHKLALVTGAASGIGRATCRQLAAAGARVVCADLERDDAEATVASLAEVAGTGSALRLDVTDEAAWQAAFEEIVARGESLDVLVNCAGISHAAPLCELTLADWRRVMAVNLDGVFLGTKHAVRHMRERGVAGSIINVSSASGIKAAPGAAAYSTSKAAVCMLSKVAAAECLQDGPGIRVNTVLPGAVRTPMWTAMPFFRDLVAETGSEAAAWQALAARDPKSRFADPDEIAVSIVYLASDESRFVTGSELVIDGGFTL